MVSNLDYKISYMNHVKKLLYYQCVWVGGFVNFLKLNKELGAGDDQAHSEKK